MKMAKTAVGLLVAIAWYIKDRKVKVDGVKEGYAKASDEYEPKFHALRDEKKQVKRDVFGEYDAFICPDGWDQDFWRTKINQFVTESGQTENISLPAFLAGFISNLLGDLDGNKFAETRRQLEVIQRVVLADRKSKLELSEADRELAIDFLDRIVDPQNIKQAAQYLSSEIVSNGENQKDILSEFTRLRIEITASLENVDGCNILVLGKTGTGKSSLLNYLVGQKICEAGAGRPVTRKGIYKHEATLNNIIVNIYDSWGIEAGDKFEEWEKLISDEKEKHNVSKDSTEWFHAIIYCIQAGGHRVEDIDVNIIKQFRKEKYFLIPVLTKADLCSEEDEKIMRETLVKQCHIDASSVIAVCSEKKELRNGSSGELFGGDQLKEAIINGYCATLIGFLPEHFICLAIKEINRFRSEATSKIERREMGIFDNNENKIWLQQEVDSFAKKFKEHALPNIIRRAIERSVRTGKNLVATIDYHGDSIFGSSDDLFDANDAFWVNALKAVFCAVVAIPATVYVLIKGFVSGKNEHKEEMKKALDACCDKLIKSVEGQEKSFHKQVEGIFTQKSLPDGKPDH